MYDLNGQIGADTWSSAQEMKKTIRRAGIEARNRLSPREREEAEKKIWDLFFALPEVAAARIVMLYAAVQGEVSTYKAMEQVLASGRILVLPRAIKSSRTLQCAAVRSPGDLTEGAYGIPEPPLEADLVPEVEIDVVAVPGLLFDHTGYRLGYGAGYYDGFLAGLREDAAAVGIGFSVQMRHRVPRRRGDRRLLCMVTEKGVVRQPRVMKPDRLYSCYAVTEDIWDNHQTGIRRYIEEVAPQRERHLLLTAACAGGNGAGGPGRWRESLASFLHHQNISPADCLVIAAAGSAGLQCGEKIGAETMAVTEAAAGGGTGGDYYERRCGQRDGELCPTFIWPAC
jgi:5-formyltetrahydrofolate cyclo-ligase